MKKDVIFLKEGKEERFIELERLEKKILIKEFEGIFMKGNEDSKSSSEENKKKENE